MSQMADSETVLSAFWHRGRKKFVPLTYEDLVRRAGITPAQARGRTRVMITEGMMRSEVLRDTTNRIHIYDLTDRGKALAAAMMRGEA